MKLKHNIEITPRVGCSNVCEYCPQSTLIKRYRERIGSDKDTMMSLETFKKCISTIPKDIGLNFTGYVEPFLNPDCTDMIIHSFKKGHELLLNTTLMGMTIDDWDRMKSEGVFIVVNAYSIFRVRVNTCKMFDIYRLIA